MYRMKLLASFNLLCLSPFIQGFAPTLKFESHVNHFRSRTLLALAVASSKSTSSNTLFSSTGINQEQQASAIIPGSKVVDTFYQAWNSGDLKTLVNLLAEDCVFEDVTYPNAFRGKDTIERHFRLKPNPNSVVVDQVARDDVNNKVAVLYHLENDGVTVPTSRHISFFTLNSNTGLITSIFETVEPTNKTGPIDAVLLSVIGKLFNNKDDKSKSEMMNKLSSSSKSSSGTSLKKKANVAERYFDAWNKRDTDAAIAIFTNNCQYDDTIFPAPFKGKEELKEHLDYFANAMPSSLRFVVDDVADGGDRVGVKWHVESNGEQLLFTRGCSLYELEKGTGLVRSGIDEVEPALFKLGGLKDFAESVKIKLVEEPIRLVPLGLWVAYMYVVFFSDGILPGANALQLETRTWEEVRDLSLNFFLVSPLLNLPFSPTVHPVLEAVFNLLLSWAALFAGFLSDERKEKPNLFPVLPAVVGMQFLTSAFLLPYLVLRSSENLQARGAVSKEDLEIPAQLVENRAFGPFLGLVGAVSLWWGAAARFADFGDIEHRMASFWQLLSIDRVGSSFLVDLALFAVFQGWLIDDDLRRRGVMDNEFTFIRNVFKVVPFFGLSAYMFLRPSFPSKR